MKIKEVTGVKRIDDIRIGSSVHAVGFNLVTSASLYDEPVYVRIRISSASSGTQTQFDRMNLVTLLELESQGEGFFENSKYSETEYHTNGLITINEEGALKLEDGDFLTIDLESANEFSGVVSSMDAVEQSKHYRRVNPSAITGVTKQIDVTRAHTILIPVDKVRSVTIQGKRAVEYEQLELRLLANKINDLVCYDRVQRRIAAGLDLHIALNVADVRELVVTPVSDSETFYVYLVETLLLG